MNRKADNFLNFQERAKAFSVGDVVVPFGMFDSQAGRVTAVFPAIGMVDVEMSSGAKRFPVEDLQRFHEDRTNVDPTRADSHISDMVPVSAGPQASASKVALYWAERDRKYKMTKAELACGKPSCPNCEDAPLLKRAVFRRTEGKSERLLGCPSCLFLVHDTDIVNMTPAESASLDATAGGL